VGKLAKSVNRITKASTPNLYGLNWIIMFFFQKYVLFNYLIIKLDDRKIKHQPNTKMFFLDRDNLIENKTNPITKLNS
jgi:hypothetical protein